MRMRKLIDLSVLIWCDLLLHWRMSPTLCSHYNVVVRVYGFKCACVCTSKTRFDSITDGLIQIAFFDSNVVHQLIACGFEILIDTTYIYVRFQLSCGMYKLCASDMNTKNLNIIKKKYPTLSPRFNNDFKPPTSFKCINIFYRCMREKHV